MIVMISKNLTERRRNFGSWNYRRTCSRTRVNHANSVRQNDTGGSVETARTAGSGQCMGVHVVDPALHSSRAARCYHNKQTSTVGQQ